MLRHSLFAVGFLFIATLASAQPVVNPTKVLFTPSPDHARVTAYEWGTFAIGAVEPISTVPVPKANLTPVGSEFEFLFPRLLFGTYEHKLRACADTVCSGWAAADRQVATLPLAPSAVRTPLE